MLPPFNNFRIEIGSGFFVDSLKNKYTQYLYAKNYPLKTFEGYFHETIQAFDFPGIDLKTLTVEGLPNNRNNPNNNEAPPTINYTWAGASNENDILSASILNLTLNNTLLNYMYCFELVHNYYRRKRTVDQFQLIITIRDSADIPLFCFILSDCFISGIPPLSFAYNSTFNESKTIDISITFNDLDAKMLIPVFDVKTLTI